MTDILNAYKAAYDLAATQTFFNRFQVKRAAASFAYTGAGSGAIGATSGQLKVGGYSHKELHYQLAVRNSGSVTLQVEGRANHSATFTKLKRFSLTAANATWFLATVIPERVDWLRVGVRAASPAASDIVSAYGLFR